MSQNFEKFRTSQKSLQTKWKATFCLLSRQQKEKIR